MATLVMDKGIPYIEDIWDLDDFRSVADGYDNEKFTDEELIEAMEIVADNFDANVGIAWHNIEAAIDIVLMLRKKGE